MISHAEVEKCCKEIFDLFNKNETPREIAAVSMTIILNTLKSEGIIVEQYVIQTPEKGKTEEVH